MASIKVALFSFRLSLPVHLVLPMHNTFFNMFLMFML
jgi:hypothetical protein